MKRTIEPEPNPNPDPYPHPDLSDTQIWIEIAYLDPWPDYYKLLLVPDQEPAKSHRRISWAWVLIALLAICVSAVLLWPS